MGRWLESCRRLRRSWGRSSPGKGGKKKKKKTLKKKERKEHPLRQPCGGPGPCSDLEKPVVRRTS